MKEVIDVVKLQSKKLRGGCEVYFVTVPADIIKELGWRKGDKLLVTVTEINGKKVLIYQRP